MTEQIRCRNLSAVRDARTLDRKRGLRPFRPSSSSLTPSTTAKKQLHAANHHVIRVRQGEQIVKLLPC
jgi:hypothetical protein